jgi:hypothetical protein
MRLLLNILIVSCFVSSFSAATPAHAGGGLDVPYITDVVIANSYTVVPRQDIAIVVKVHNGNEPFHMSVMCFYTANLGTANLANTSKGPFHEVTLGGSASLRWVLWGPTLVPIQSGNSTLSLAIKTPSVFSSQIQGTVRCLLEAALLSRDLFRSMQTPEFPVLLRPNLEAYKG